MFLKNTCLGHIHVYSQCKNPPHSYKTTPKRTKPGGPGVTWNLGSLYDYSCIHMLKTLAFDYLYLAIHIWTK